MARGSAQDVTLPLLESEEYDHLARRAGYASDGRFSAASQLHLDIETQSATVRRFVERYFTRSSLPSQRIGNVVDLILVDSVPPELQQKIMTQVGFKNPTRAYFNLMKLAKSGKNRDQFAKLGVLAFDALLHKADPDRALNNWERFAREVPNPDAHFKLLLRQPMRLDILLDIFSSSQFLSDTLIQHPNYFSWATHPHILRQEIRRGVFSEELGTLKRTCRNLKEWYRELRRFRRKELLRIAIRDICLQESLVSITRSLSLLAESIVQIALEYAWEYVIPEEETRRVFENRFCILAFGKCGASELNYSSDIDLIAFYEDEKSDEKNADEIRAIYKKVIDRLTQSLTAYTEEGYVYRMDFTLRPFGRSGEWLSSFAGLTRYYQNSAALWEIQALLKTRPLAGNWWLGWTFLHDISSLLRRPYPKEDIIASIKKLRELSAQKSGKHGQVVDIKSGHGGIRDIEFLAQGLQLIYGQRFPEIFTRKTLSTLERLKRVGLLPFEIGEQLKKYYIFFRQLEHFMQLVEDRRIHALPKDRHELESLAKKLLGNRATPEQLMAYLENSLSTVHQIFNDYLG